MIYETINSLRNHNEFLNSRSKINILLADNFVKTNLDLRVFKKKYGYNTHINRIRNKISAHINENFEEYCAETSSFDGEKTALMCFNFFKIIESFQNLLNEIKKTSKLNY